MGESEKTPRRSVKKARCAIYTRKSSEEGLEQAFNSLDAQREACAAFILSQKHPRLQSLWLRLDVSCSACEKSQPTKLRRRDFHNGRGRNRACKPSLPESL